MTEEGATCASRSPSAPDVVELALRLVRFASVQTESFEADPQVQAFISTCVAPVLDDLGIPSRRDRMGNLIARLGDGDGPTILLMGYAMTHPASRMRDPFAGQLVATADGQAVRGRGIAEQKGALAALLAAIQSLTQHRIAGRIILVVSTAGETGTHDAARAVVEALDRIPDFAVIAIGTGGRVSLANKGRIDVDVMVEGRASHSSTPWRGLNAITGAQLVLDRLDAIQLPKQHPNLGAATLVPTAIRSFPDATHTIQDEVRLTFDRRLLPTDEPGPAFAQIEEALDGIAPWRVSARLTRVQLPAEISVDHPLVEAVVAGHAAAGLPEPAFFHSHGCLDAGYLQTLGCPSIMWGPGEPDHWHAEEEVLLTSDLVRGASAYAGFLRVLLGGSGDADA